ncbi:MAG TPA: hypothetical protein VK925_00290, partial [Jiangellaceae bacterium]|nr:hypothetical protein [Jiangellaceae bacterium]
MRLRKVAELAPLEAINAHQPGPQHTVLFQPRVTGVPTHLTLRSAVSSWTVRHDLDMIGNGVAWVGEGGAVSHGGRDQLGPIERLVRVLAVLDGAGPAGATQEQLLEVARYGATAPDAQRRMLTKDISYLNDAGWDIQNVAEPGKNARYVLEARDIRLRVELSPSEQAELARVGRLAGVDEFADYVGTDAGPPEHPSGSGIYHDGHPADVQLALCLEAAARRRVVQFIY